MDTSTLQVFSGTLLLSIPAALYVYIVRPERRERLLMNLICFELLGCALLMASKDPVVFYTLLLHIFFVGLLLSRHYWQPSRLL